MTKEQFEQKKKEIGFIEGNLKVDNVQKIFTILKEVNNISEWNSMYSSSVDYSKVEPLDYSLPQYTQYANRLR
jgi:hypothetical protein